AGNRLIQRTGDGKSQPLAGDDQPGLAIVERTFDALFTLDVSQLAQRFRMYALPAQAAGGKDWTLGLVPQDAALAEHLRAVVISGAQHVQRVTLYQGAGDRTEIHFDDVTVARALSPQQKALFAP
ncbi:MAG TPA: LolA-related protein, partial [Nevskiaceae bacterium]